MFCVEMENGSIKTQNRVVFTLMLLLLLSIGCALRLPSSFCLIHSHQRLFVDSRGFFLREYHSNGCGKINPSNCHLQYVYWVTGMTYDPLELEKDKSTTIPFIVRSNAENEVFLFGLHCMCYRGR